MLAITEPPWRTNIRWRVKSHLRNVPADFTVEAEKVVFVGVLYARYHPVREVAIKYGLVGATAFKLWREVLLVVKQKVWLTGILDYT